MKFELDRNRKGYTPDVWYVYWVEPAKGKGLKQIPRHKSTFTKDRGAAELVKAQLVIELDRPKDVSASEMSLQKVMLKYYERRGHSRFAQGPIKYAQREIEDYLPGVTVAGFDDALQVRYINTLMQTGEPEKWLPPPIDPATGKPAARGEPQADTTVARRLRVLRAAVNMLVKSKELARDTVPYIQFPEPTERDDKAVKAVKLPQLQAWFKAASTLTEKLMLLIWLCTLCRAMQALDLTWGQIDFEEGTIDFKVPGRRITKKRRAKLLMCPALIAFLRPLAGAPDEHVILTYRDGKPVKGYSNQVRDLRKKSGSGGAPQGIRKAGASYLANAGVPVPQVQAMLAHNVAPGVTWRYIEADLPAAVRTMQELVSKLEAPWVHPQSSSASQSAVDIWQPSGSREMEVIEFSST